MIDLLDLALYYFLCLFVKDRKELRRLIFPCVMSEEEEKFLHEYNKQHGHLDPLNAKSFVVDGKTYKFSVISS